MYSLQKEREKFTNQNPIFCRALVFVLNSKDQKEDYTSNKSNITEFLGLLVFTQVL